MSLMLDARRRAMLEEMGVRTWVPATPPAARDEAPPVSVAAPAVAGTAQIAVRAPTPAPAPASPAPVATPAPAVAAPVVASGRLQDVAALDWAQLEATVAGCQACALCQGRRNTVFGAGDRRAQWMIVGEAPGEREDESGQPFVGPAGQLLDNMLKSVGLSREAGAYIVNVLKCRPPGNRNPEPAEVLQCEPYLRRQIALVQPRLILAMGRFAVQSLLRSNEAIGRLRGRPHSFDGVPLVVTYHPAYLLRNLPDKAKAWADLCLAAQLLRDSAGR